MVHITEKRFRKRPSKVPRIKVYSNAGSAELFINGSSAGRIESTSLNPGYPTVFIWENILLLSKADNEIRVLVTLENGSVLEDTAIWYGEDER